MNLYDEVIVIDDYHDFTSRSTPFKQTRHSPLPPKSKLE